jgi:hypothetical protein
MANWYNRLGSAIANGASAVGSGISRAFTAVRNSPIGRGIAAATSFVVGTVSAVGIGIAAGVATWVGLIGAAIRIADRSGGGGEGGIFVALGIMGVTAAAIVFGWMPGLAVAGGSMLTAGVFSAKAGWEHGVYEGCISATAENYRVAMRVARREENVWTSLGRYWRGAAAPAPGSDNNDALDHVEPGPGPTVASASVVSRLDDVNDVTVKLAPSSSRAAASQKDDDFDSIGAEKAAPKRSDEKSPPPPSRAAAYSAGASKSAAKTPADSPPPIPPPRTSAGHRKAHAAKDASKEEVKDSGSALHKEDSDRKAALASKIARDFNDAENFRKILQALHMEQPESNTTQSTSSSTAVAHSAKESERPETKAHAAVAVGGEAAAAGATPASLPYSGMWQVTEEKAAAPVSSSNSYSSGSPACRIFTTQNGNSQFEVHKDKIATKKEDVDSFYAMLVTFSTLNPGKIPRLTSHPDARTTWEAALKKANNRTPPVYLPEETAQILRKADFTRNKRPTESVATPPAVPAAAVVASTSTPASPAKQKAKDGLSPAAAAAVASAAAAAAAPAAAAAAAAPAAASAAAAEAAAPQPPASPRMGRGSA